MPRIQRKRLFRAAKALRRWKPNKKKEFRISGWSETHKCGTTCCAIGYLASLKYFNDDGLKLAVMSRIYTVQKQPYYRSGKHTYWRYYAVAKYFGITVEDAQCLFSPSSYPIDVKKDDIADRIESFAMKGIKIEYNYA